MQEYGVDMRHIILVFAFCGKGLPVRVVTECFPKPVMVGHAVESDHIHQVGHVTTSYYFSIKNRVETKPLKQGNFITIEPGLYYPDKGIGMRIEDSFIIDELGKLIPITDFHKDLVLPLKG